MLRTIALVMINKNAVTYIEHYNVVNTVVSVLRTVHWTRSIGVLSSDWIMLVGAWILSLIWILLSFSRRSLSLVNGRFGDSWKLPGKHL